MSPLRIESLPVEPVDALPYQAAVAGKRIAWVELPVLLGTVSGLPQDLDAIVATSDLQGRSYDWDRKCVGGLLGEAVADALPGWLSESAGIDPERAGVLLAGDLFAKDGLRGRGGSGDVRPVWDAFACVSRWVAGVAGNHDVFGPGWSLPHLEEFKARTDVHLLDGTEVDLEGLRIAGLSGIIGPPRKPFRRTEEDFVTAVRDLAATAPDVLVLHDGPDVEGESLPGNPRVRAALEDAPQALVIRGHAHWREPLHELRNGTQILNVDSRVAILQRATV